MRSTTHGSLATVLLMVPILSIPMLAIFGVPQFAPLMESFSAGNHDQDHAGTSDSDAPAFAPAHDWEEGEFSPAVSSRSESPEAWQNPGTSTTQMPDSAWENIESAVPAASAPTPTASTGNLGPQGDLRTASVRALAESPAGRQVVPARGETAATELTWKMAVQRLNQLEIRNFRLEPGQQAGQFVFICSYTPQNSPRLSYRFEAEADEPLRAVEKVLGQIDTWMASR